MFELIELKSLCLVIINRLPERSSNNHNIRYIPKNGVRIETFATSLGVLIQLNLYMSNILLIQNRYNISICKLTFNALNEPQ